jgi:hypothetical protein
MTRRPRISTRWFVLPLALWALCACVSAAWLWQIGEYRSGASTRALYDSGTKAAMKNDLARAAVDLRRAQRIAPGILPLGDSLGHRIDSNLAEVRRRVAQSARPDPESSAEVPPGDGTTVSAAVQNNDSRSKSDRALALVRAVPLPARFWLAAAAVGLLVSLAAARSLRVASGARAWPRAMPMVTGGFVAAAAAAFAVIDRVHDVREPEAVLMRAEVPRTGPDDLTYPPAATFALPAGTELLVRGRNEDGRWTRVVPLDGQPSADTAAGMWLPSAAIERID